MTSKEILSFALVAKKEKKNALKENITCGSNSRSYTSVSSLEGYSESGDDLHEMLAAEQSGKTVVGVRESMCEVSRTLENGPMHLSHEASAGGKSLLPIVYNDAFHMRSLQLPGGRLC